MKHKHVSKGAPADPFEAFRQLVYGFGVVELAKLMAIKPGTLYNKADADEDTHHQPTLRDVLLATRLTGDFRVLDALDEAFGRAGFDVAHMAEVSDMALLELLTRLGKENGEFHGALAFALAGPSITPQHLAQIKAEAYDVVGALMTLVARLEGLVDE